MCNSVGNSTSPQIQQLLNSLGAGAPIQQAGPQLDPIQQLMGMMQQGGGMGGAGLDPRMLRQIIRQLDRQIVQSMLGGQGGMDPTSQFGGAGGIPGIGGPCGQQQGFPGLDPSLSGIPGMGNCFPQNALANAFPGACAPNPCAAPQAAPAPLQEIKGTAKNGWLCDHGKYKKDGNNFKLDDGRMAVPVDGKPGQFTVMGPDGQPQGIFNAPGGANKIASPLSFDLNGDGKVSTTGTQNGRQIDINGDGKVDQSAWAGKGDGVLAFGNGASGKQLFGNNTDVDGDGKADGYANGFQALKAFATKHLGAQAVADGKLDSQELAALQQKAGLYMDVGGQKVGIAQAGVGEINLAAMEAGQAADENGNEHRQQGAFTRTNGQQGKVDDVWFKYA